MAYYRYGPQTVWLSSLKVDLRPVYIVCCGHTHKNLTNTPWRQNCGECNRIRGMPSMISVHVRSWSGFALFVGLWFLLFIKSFWKANIRWMTAAFLGGLWRRRCVDESRFPVLGLTRCCWRLRQSFRRGVWWASSLSSEISLGFFWYEIAEIRSFFWRISRRCVLGMTLVWRIDSRGRLARRLSPVVRRRCRIRCVVVAPAYPNQLFVLVTGFDCDFHSLAALEPEHWIHNWK